jgi:hypothetical protein
MVAASLTFALGMLSHLVVEATVMGDRLELLTRSHLALGLVASALLGWSLRRIGGPRGERRRNLALLRAALRADTPGFSLAAGLAQAGIAVAILLLEHIAIAPGQMLAALASGLLALVAGMLFLRFARRRIVVILMQWARAIVGPTANLRAAVQRGARSIGAAILLSRTRPDRAPPTLLIA